MRIVFCFFLVLTAAVFAPLAMQAQQTLPGGDVKTTPAATPVDVVAIDNRIKVCNAAPGSRLEIYSVVGVKVADIEIKQSCGEYVVSIAKGYYIIRIGETVRKVAIR